MWQTKELENLREKHNRQQHHTDQRPYSNDMHSMSENPRKHVDYTNRELTKTISAMKLDDRVKEMQRQKLRSNYEELRNLDRQLKAARMRYDIEQQNMMMTEKRKEELCLKKEEELNEAAKREHQAKLWNQLEVQQQNKKIKLRSTLLEQIADQQKRRQDECKEQLLWRERMEDLKRIIEQRDERHRQADIARKEREKQEIKEFMENWQRVRAEERRKEAEEREAHLKIMQEREEQERKATEAKRQQVEAKQKLSMEIGERIRKDEEAKRVREVLLQDLLIAESRAKEEERLKKELQRIIDERERARQENEHYTKELLQKLRCVASEDDIKFLKEREQYLAEQDKKEKLKNEQKERAKQEYKRDLSDMIVEKRHERAEATAAELRRSEAVREYNQKIDQEIKDERQRMLSEQPPEVLRYLSSSALRDQDRELLRKMLQKSLSST